VMDAAEVQQLILVLQRHIAFELAEQAGSRPEALRLLTVAESASRQLCQLAPAGRLTSSSGRSIWRSFSGRRRRQRPKEQRCKQLTLPIVSCRLGCAGWGWSCACFIGGATTHTCSCSLPTDVLPASPACLPYAMPFCSPFCGHFCELEPGCLPALRRRGPPLVSARGAGFGGAH
jgi:hypothetical protein